MTYLSFKFAHVLIAIVALGSSAALGLVLGFFADDPAHGAFALRVVRRLLWAVVIPGYVLMLATGLDFPVITVGDMVEVHAEQRPCRFYANRMPNIVAT